jgi:hypothetical protein
MWELFWKINGAMDPSIEALQRQLQARPRHIKFAPYIERYINRRGED